MEVSAGSRYPPALMHPVLFEIPGLGFPLRSFGALVAGGFLLGVWVWGRLLSRYGDDPKQDPIRASQVGMWVLIGVLAGARVMYVAVESARYLAADVTPAIETYLGSDDRPLAGARLSIDDPAAYETARNVVVGYDFLHDPFQIIAIWQGGMVMYGGFLGAILLGMWSAKKQGLNPLTALDTGLIAGFCGQAVGRWGCLMVGDDYGSVVPEGLRHLPFPLTITVPSLEWLQAHPESLFAHALAGETLWATQIWMSVNAVIIALAGIWFLRRRRWRGQVAAIVILWYAITRFAIESFRGDEIRGVWFGGISTSQLVSIPFAALALFLLIRFRARDDQLATAAS